MTDQLEQRLEKVTLDFVSAIQELSIAHNVWADPTTGAVSSPQETYRNNKAATDERLDAKYKPQPRRDISARPANPLARAKQLNVRQTERTVDLIKKLSEHINESQSTVIEIAIDRLAKEMGVSLQ